MLSYSAVAVDDDSPTVGGNLLTAVLLMEVAIPKIALAAVGSADQVPLVRSLLIVLVSTAVISLLVRRLRLVGIPVYLITGAVIGPHAVRLVRSPENLAEISHFAIILLLFGIGLDVHLSALKRGAVRLVAAGVGSCVVTVLIAWPIVTLSGLPVPVALVIAMGLALSSTAVVLRIFSEQRRLRSAGGRLALAILVLQDLIVLLMLAALPVIARWASARGELEPSALVPLEAGAGFGSLIARTAFSLAAIAALVFFGRRLLPRLLSESARGRSLDALLIVSIATALATAYAAQALGFSLEMGAFLAGFLLSATPFRHQLMGQIGPLRDLFMAVFFTSIGMQVDPGVLAEWWWAVVLGGAVLMILKSIVIGSTCWILGATVATAVSVGFCLAQAGEFSLVLMEAARMKGILGSQTSAIIIAIVVLSLVFTPLLTRIGFQLERRLIRVGVAPWVKSYALRDVPGMRRAGDLPIGEAESDGSGRPVKYAIIGGYGPVGRSAAETLGSSGVQYTVVELNPATVREIRGSGGSAVYGDVANAEVLESAGIARADALLITIPDDQAVMRACAAARHVAPDIFISARVSALAHKGAVESAGASCVIVDEIAAAEAMTRACMRDVERQ